MKPERHHYWKYCLPRNHCLAIIIFISFMLSDWKDKSYSHFCDIDKTRMNNFVKCSEIQK